MKIGEQAAGNIGRLGGAGTTRGEKGKMLFHKALPRMGNKKGTTCVSRRGFMVEELGQGKGTV